MHLFPEYYVPDILPRFVNNEVMKRFGYGLDLQNEKKRHGFIASYWSRFFFLSI
jgi:hypothetical protein